jgi:hypothetical protein
LDCNKIIETASANPGFDGLLYVTWTGVDATHSSPVNLTTTKDPMEAILFYGNDVGN